MGVVTPLRTFQVQRFDNQLSVSRVWFTLHPILPTIRFPTPPWRHHNLHQELLAHRTFNFNQRFLLPKVVKSSTTIDAFSQCSNAGPTPDFNPRSNSGRLRTFLVLCTPLVVMINISSLRSLMPMNAPSCHLGSNFACLAPPGHRHDSFSNSTSCLRCGFPACNSHAVRPSRPTGYLINFTACSNEKCQNGMSRSSRILVP